MLALIMAGGGGSRLGMGEKSMVTIAGKPMLLSVISAFTEAGHSIVVALTNRCPYTMNWCRANGIDFIETRGMGYVEDLIEAVKEIGEKSSLFTSVSDIPCIEAPIIQRIWSYHQRSGKKACSTWVPLELTQKLGISIRHIKIVDGENACPVGVNILNGKDIETSQDEYKLLLNESSLAFHVNTRQDLEVVKKYFNTKIY